MPSKSKAQGSILNPVRRTTNWHCLRTIPLLLAAGSSPLRPRHALSDDVFVFLALGHTRKPVLSTCLTEKPLDHVKSVRLWSSWGILMDSHPCLCDHAPMNTSHNKAWEAAAAGHTPWPGLTSLPGENRVAGVGVLRLHPQISCALGWFYSALFCDQVR